MWTPACVTTWTVPSFPIYIPTMPTSFRPPFKALQMGNVWRADRPQRGRFRQFMQCDIDILGEPTYLAEIELVLATTTLLGKLDFHNFTIRINDRKILKAMSPVQRFSGRKFRYCIYHSGQNGQDRSGGSCGENLKKKDSSKESNRTPISDFSARFTGDIQGVRYLKEKLKDVLAPEVAEDLENHHHFRGRCKDG